MSKVYASTDEAFIALVNGSTSYSDTLRNVGLTTSGGSASKLLKKRIADLKIPTDHFEDQRNINKQQHTLDEILVADSPYTNINRLKIRLVNEGVMTYACVKCGNPGVWNNVPLALQLDHENGISNDHRRENLRFLCPNCHAQTDTYCGKNKGVSFSTPG